MKLSNTKHSSAISIVVAALIPLILDGAPAHAATRHEASPTLAQPGRLADGDNSQPQIGYGATLFATWGTVTTGNSSTNAAEYRKTLTGGHAGSANAAEAPAFSTRSR